MLVLAGRKNCLIIQSMQEVKRVLPHPSDRFMTQLFEETKDIPKSKFYTGKHYPKVRTLLNRTLEELRAAGAPELLLFNAYYISDYLGREVELDQILSDTKIVAERIRGDNKFRFFHLAESDLIPAMSGQKIEPNLLSTPPFSKQEYTYFTYTCSNACFRMIYGGITRERLSQFTVVRALQQTYPRDRLPPLVDDEVYLSVFQTPTFRETFGTDVRFISFAGVDFKEIGEIVRRVKDKDPEVDVYCMLNVSSDSAGASHSVILLEAGLETITVHDPNKFDGNPWKSRPKNKFIRRWARELLRGHLVFSKKAS